MCQVWLKLVQWFLRRWFLNFVNVFYCFVLISIGKGLGPSFEQTWIPLPKWCLVPSLVKISTVVLKKKNLKISLMYFHYFVIISPWKIKDWTLHLNKESLVKIGTLVLEKKIFNSCQYIFTISQLYSLVKGHGHSFEETWISFS